MRTLWTDYSKARERAIEIVTETQVPVGIERLREFGTEKFRMFFLPRKENRSGFELTVEAFEPEDYK